MGPPDSDAPGNGALGNGGLGASGEGSDAVGAGGASFRVERAAAVRVECDEQAATETMETAATTAAAIRIDDIADTTEPPIDPAARSANGRIVAGVLGCVYGAAAVDILRCQDQQLGMAAATPDRIGDRC